MSDEGEGKEGLELKGTAFRACRTSLRGGGRYRSKSFGVCLAWDTHYCSTAGDCGRFVLNR